MSDSWTPLSRDVAHTSAEDKKSMRCTGREGAAVRPHQHWGGAFFILKEKKKKETKGTTRNKNAQSRWSHTGQDALGEGASPGLLCGGNTQNPPTEMGRAGAVGFGLLQAHG